MLPSYPSLGTYPFDDIRLRPMVWVRSSRDGLLRARLEIEKAVPGRLLSVTQDSGAAVVTLTRAWTEKAFVLAASPVFVLISLAVTVGVFFARATASSLEQLIALASYLLAAAGFRELLGVSMAGTTVTVPSETVPLRQVADLDNPLGYKGNYIIFPLLKDNVVTSFMKAPYLDNVKRLQDPDPAGNWTLESFTEYLCCLKKMARTAAEFDALKPGLEADYRALLESEPPDAEEILVPTGSMFIEALPGTHPILEDFKLMHRAVDVKKAQAEVRKVELENVRYAVRIAAKKYEDPEVEKLVVVEGQGTGVVVTP